MAIRGSLSEATLPDVLQLLALGGKTGRLTLTDRSNVGHIHFDAGRICHATIVNRRDRLGDILVKNGEITQAQLEAAIERQSRERDKRLGQLLVESGALSRETLERYMRFQIEEAVYALFTWSRGTFQFESDVHPESEDFLVSIPPQSLLLEGARRVDEWSLIERKIPSFDLIFAIDREALATCEGPLTAEQQRLAELLDGRRDVAALVEESGLSEFAVAKALYGLVAAGFAHRTGRSRAAPTAQERAEGHRALGVAFYRAGMLDEALGEFQRLAELRPTDGSAHFHRGLIAARQSRWDDAVAAFRRAGECGGLRPALLHNLALCHELQGDLGEAEVLYAQAAALAPSDGRVLTGWGITALARGDCREAAARLDRARAGTGEAAPPPLWYWARSLAAAAQGAEHEAEALLREGLTSHPAHPVLCNNLAVLLERRGEGAEAEALLRTALAEDAPVPQLAKNLGDLLHRADRYDDAWELYQRAVRLAPELGADVYYKLGTIAYRRLDRDAAARYWRAALEIDPEHAMARASLEGVTG